MNALLWRAEYGDTDRGSRVSNDVVLNKIFNAPDASNLRVSQNGTSLGFVHWKIIPDEVYFSGTNQPAGRVESITGYTLALDGRIQVESIKTKMRFTLRSTLDAGLGWQNVSATIDLPPSTWEFAAAATNQVLSVKHDGALGQWERTTPLGQLRNPAALLEHNAFHKNGLVAKETIGKRPQQPTAQPRTGQRAAITKAFVKTAGDHKRAGEGFRNAHARILRQPSVRM